MCFWHLESQRGETFDVCFASDHGLNAVKGVADELKIPKIYYIQKGDEGNF